MVERIIANDELSQPELRMLRVAQMQIKQARDLIQKEHSQRGVIGLMDYSTGSLLTDLNYEQVESFMLPLGYVAETYKLSGYLVNTNELNDEMADSFFVRILDRYFTYDVVEGSFIEFDVEDIEERRVFSEALYEAMPEDAVQEFSERRDILLAALKKMRGGITVQ